MTHAARFVMLSLLCLLIAPVSFTAAREPATSGDWPMFRGPQSRSIGQATALPVEWSAVDGKNIAWRADLPGRGVSGPIVVAGKVFITASSGPNRDRLHVLAFDANSGKQLWHRQFWATGKSLCHKTSANAAPTPASDGQRVFAFFSSNDLIALDFAGNLLWMRGLELDYPGAGNALGMASSPVVAGDVVVVQSEAQGNSFVAAINCSSGRTVWDLERPKASNWSSPIVIDAEYTADRQAAIALQSTEGIALHRADTGAQLYSTSIVCESIPSLTFNKFLYVASNGLQVFDILPESLDSKDATVWSESKLQAGSPSPVVSEDCIYTLKGEVLRCGLLETQEVAWKLRLSGRFWATPVLVNDYLYCVNSDGKCFVVDVGQPGKKGRIVAENEFQEDVLGSPAVAANGLFVRSHSHLWKVAN